MNRTFRFVKFTTSNGSIIFLNNNHINFRYSVCKLTLQVGGVTIGRRRRGRVRRVSERFVVMDSGIDHRAIGSKRRSGTFCRGERAGSITGRSDRSGNRSVDGFDD